MSDPFESDLSRLAPDIDLDRARQAFESTRSRRRKRRRAAGGLGGAALAAVLVAGVIATGGDGTESVTADGPIGFGPSLTGTVGDVNDEWAGGASCIAAADAGMNTIIFLDPAASADDPAASVFAVATSFDPDATYVSQETMRAEAVEGALASTRVAPPWAFPASIRLRVDPDDFGTVAQALSGDESVLEVRSMSAGSLRSLCLTLPRGSVPLTSTTSDVADEALRQSPCEPRRGSSDCVRPTDIEPALGRVVERFTTGVGDEFGYVIEFAPDSPWTWRDMSGGEHSDAELIEDPTRVSIVPTAGVDLHQSCEDRPEVGARAEAVPAGPLNREPGGLVSGGAWLTLSCVDLELARQLWADSGITLYTQRFEGWLDGRGIGPQVDVSDGVVTRGAGFDTQALFERIEAAMTDGDIVHALFDPTLGFVDRLVIEGAGEVELDITSRDFRAAARASACPGPAGGPLDLTAEPVGWALSGELTRWFDPAGCPIRLDVIQQSWGPAHCSMERAQFMSVPPSVDLEATDDRRTYVFDPDRTLSHRSEEQWGRLASPDQRPPGLVDTGLRSAEGHEMWIDPEDADHLWLIRDDELQVWRLDPDGYTFVCF